MALTLNEVQESLLALLENNFIQPVFEVAVPESETLERDATGAVIDYLAVQFADMQVTDRAATSFVGPRYDDYQQPMYIQAVSGSARTARRLRNKINDVMLGSGHPFSGLVRKGYSSGAHPILGTNQATEAYLFPTSFHLPFQAEIEEL